MQFHAVRRAAMLSVMSHVIQVVTTRDVTATRAHAIARATLRVSQARSPFLYSGLIPPQK